MAAQRVSEQFLRQLWLSTSVLSKDLLTTRGEQVDVLFPGRPNSNGGPDFLDALIRVNGTLFSGDVEVHIDARSWYTHGHDRDPHYNRTILHVVMHADEDIATITHSGRNVPILPLSPALTAPASSYEPDPGLVSHRLPCSGMNGGVLTEVVRPWVVELGWQRIEMKILRMEDRLKQLIDEERLPVCEPHPLYYDHPGDIPPSHEAYTRADFANRKIWEQLLYEGIMDALGYAKNRRSFTFLAQSVRLELLRSIGLSDTTAVMAVLFGAAGLLPSTRVLAGRDARRYVRHLRKRWGALRPLFRGTHLHEGDWLFFRLRPSNFPTARLAAVCFLLPVLFGPGGMEMLLSPFRRRDLSVHQRVMSLSARLNFEPDSFWKVRHHFHGGASGNGVRLGTMRRNDMMINVIIPWALLFARMFADADIRESARAVASALPPSQENTITRIIQRELLNGRPDGRTALYQQGMIQLYRWYCIRGRCSECAVGRAIGFTRHQAAGQEGDPEQTPESGSAM